MYFRSLIAVWAYNLFNPNQGMSIRFWSILIPVVVVAGAAIFIYLDYSEHQTGGLAEEDFHQHVHAEQSDAEGDTGEYETSIQEPDSSDLARILEIEEELDQTDNRSLKIAYYGEIIQRYMKYDRLDGAGDAGYRLAALTDELDDWVNAGDWFYAWLDQEPNENRRYYFASRAAEAYGRALEITPSDYGLRTDKAAALVASGNAERAAEELKLALEENPDHLDANYNLGVILHQMGSKDESISYLRRSVDLAEGTDRQEVVERFISEHDVAL